MNLISQLFSGASRRAAAHLYASAVAAARAPGFYRDLGIADTVEGRYEMVVLHTALLLLRLNREGQARAALRQAVLDVMAADLDRSMREMGVGDLSVGKYMKRLGQGFYGRGTAYEAAFAAGDRQSLSESLVRNVYDGADPGPQVAAALTDYVLRQVAHLAAQPAESLAQGRVDFLVFEQVEL